MIIATHDGTFHADETTACAILTYLFENHSIIRSRDEEELEKADIIIDVSQKNDTLIITLKNLLYVEKMVLNMPLQV